MPDHLNLVYGDAPRTRLDFFATKRPGAPTLLFFHGGYWQRNTKERFSFVGEGPLAHGFHVAVAGYTLAPAATMDGIVREARTALHWLHQKVETLGGDPAQLYVAVTFNFRAFPIGCDCRSRFTSALAISLTE